MTLDMLAIIMIIGFVALFVLILITFFFLNLKIHHVFYDLDTKMDRMATETRNRDDNLALRIDELYRGLLKKAA